MSFRTPNASLAGVLADYERRLRALERRPTCCPLAFRVTDEGLLQFSQDGGEWVDVVILGDYELPPEESDAFEWSSPPSEMT